MHSPKEHKCAVTHAEIAAFIIISIAMGIVNMFRVHYYWSTNPVLNHPWFQTVMPRDRFYLIQKYLYFNDNSLAVNKEITHVMINCSKSNLFLTL